MNVSDLMTADPACCRPSDTIQAAAQMMLDRDCGQIPVVDEGGRLVGVITDRDIACRCVAEGKSSDAKVSDAMSRDVVTAAPDEDLESCCAKMEDRQVRRLPVIDEAGCCCGIISQADVATNANREVTGDLVRQVSEPA